jgi:hypothetical protein
LWANVEAIILEEHAQHRSREKAERYVRRHLKRHFAGLKASAITYQKLLAFKQRLEEGASPSTVRNELSLVRTGLVVAWKAGKLAMVPSSPRCMLRT